MSNLNISILRKTHSELKVKQVVNTARREGAAVETVTKMNSPNIKNVSAGQSIMKLEHDTVNLKHEKIPLDLAKLISQTRLAKGFSQKDLATKIYEKVQVINDYEAGRAIPNNAILIKIERALGIKLLGTKNGQTLKAKANKRISK